MVAKTRKEEQVPIGDRYSLQDLLGYVLQNQRFPEAQALMGRVLAHMDKQEDTNLPSPASVKLLPGFRVVLTINPVFFAELSY